MKKNCLVPTIEKLKEALKSLNLPQTGNKQTLLDRLAWAELNQDPGIFEENLHGSQDATRVWDIKFSTTGPVFKRIPKAARLQAAKTFAEILTEICSKNDEKSWEKLLQYPRYCFGGTARGGKKKKSQATIINKRIDSFMKESLQPEVNKARKSPPSLKDQVKAKLSVGDVSGAVRIISSCDTVLPVTLEVKDKLVEKHPPPLTTVNLPPTCDTENAQCTRDEVKKAIKSFKPGSSGGQDGLLPQHLVDLTSDELGEPAVKLLDALSDFFNLIMFPGQVPNQICATIYGASLIALSKSCGGVRPIAVGLTLRRLASKILMKKLYPKCKTLFFPHQLGVGTPKGAESAVHTVRAYIEKEKMSEKVLLKVDFRNAFNQISRNAVLQSVKTHVPEIYPFVHQSYATSSSLFYGGSYKIESREGVQQGDPLGPFLFSLPTMDLIKACKSELRLFYLDDGTLAGDVDSVLSDYKLIQTFATTLGLEVNPSKCEFYQINQKHNQNVYEKFCNASPGQVNLKLLQAKDLTLLGSPILPEAIESVLKTKLDSLKLMAERLSTIDAHDALFLLRNCFSMPKLTYFLRTAPCFLNKAILQEYDAYIRHSIQKILNVRLEEAAWNQSTLPINLGGLGLKLASEVALPAFLSSAYSSSSTIKDLIPTIIQVDHFYELGCTEWKEKLNLDILPNNPAFQSEWDRPLYLKRQKQLLDSALTDTERARILGVSAEHASDWLSAIPISSLGLKLPDSSLRVICALRLGSPICQQHNCLCGVEVDSLGRHGLSCKNQIGRHPRHSQVNDLVKRALSSADIPSRLEPPGLSRKDGKRPDGMTLFPYKEGKSLVWDFTCIDTMANSYLKETSKQAGAAAEKAEKSKLSKYEEICKDYYMVPIAIETLGAIGHEGACLIKDIGKKIQDLTGEKRSTFFLYQSISMAVQRGNAASILGTVRSGEKLDEIFYL